MFTLSRRQRINRLKELAESFCREKYQEAKAEEVRVNKASESGIRYSIDEADDHPDDDGPRPCAKYSLRGDSYNPERINRALKVPFSSADSDAINSALAAGRNLTFVETVNEYIKDIGWSYSKVYKAAQIDRRLFSKMMSDIEYKPSKDTAIAMAIALQLDLEQAKDLLDRAGYSLSHSDKRDIVIEYFLQARVFNMNDINIVLGKLSMKTIGRF